MLLYRWVWVILVTYTDVIYHSFRIGMFVGTNVMCYLFSLAGMGVLFGLKLWKLFFKDVLLCEIKIWMVYKLCKTGFKTSCWVIFFGNRYDYVYFFWNQALTYFQLHLETICSYFKVLKIDSMINMQIKIYSSIKITIWWLSILCIKAIKLWQNVVIYALTITYFYLINVALKIYLTL